MTPATEQTAIKVRYSTVDGFKKARTFKTLKGARDFAHHFLGKHPDLGTSYAISSDGIGKITVQGASLADLFPAAADEPVIRKPVIDVAAFNDGWKVAIGEVDQYYDEAMHNLLEEYQDKLARRLGQ
jgi:hypothetical protein